jgi:hypothetical protein
MLVTCRTLPRCSTGSHVSSSGRFTSGISQKASAFQLSHAVGQNRGTRVISARS